MSGVQRASLSVLTVAFSLLWLNEARSSGKTSNVLETEALSSVQSQSTKALLASMTFESAVSVMDASGRADKKIIEMIQDQGHRGHKKMRGGSQPVDGQPTGSAGNSQSNYNSGVWAALHRMNDMLLETLEKWDLKKITCEHYDLSTAAFKEDIEEDLLVLKPLIATAMSDKNAAASKIKTHKDAASKLTDEIKTFLEEMVAELTNLNAQLRVARSDQKVMNKILGMTQCSDEASDASSMVQTNTELLQCKNNITGKSYEKIKIRSEELRKQFAGMQHPKIISLLRAAGINVADNAQLTAAFIQKEKRLDCGCACHNNANVSYQALFGADERNNTCNIADPKRFGFLDNCCLLNRNSVENCCPTEIPPEFQVGVAVTNTSSEVDPAMEGEKCSIAGSSNCPELRERFENINGGIWDTINQLRYLISQTEFRKEQGHQIMQAELTYHNDVAESENEKFGRATSEWSTLLESQRMKTNLRDTSESDRKTYMDDCVKTIKEFESEYCALMIIRGKLLEMDALPNNVTDCRVSDWEAEACSLTCGNGVQWNRRTSEIEPDHGYNCPALEVKTPCPNIDQRCPIDCELGDWTGWSACSAYCDGGVMDRIRPTLQHPSHDGTPCEQSDDAQDCNTQACDKDCVLHDWTEWSPSCTKMCGGGRVIRYRHVKEHEFGKLGTCAEFHDASRFQWKPCNTQDCVYDEHQLVLCEAKKDIILAIDGSGSLTEAGWEALKLSALHFAGSMGSGIKLGAMVFDSAKYIKESEVCMGDRLRSNWTGPWTNCGVRWAHKLDMDTGAVQEAIRGMSSTRRGTMTNKAVDEAMNEFARNGREYAQSILVVFTDGYPVSKDKLRQSAEKYKDTGRLMFVVVGDGVLDDPYWQTVVTGDISSEEYKENLIGVKDFKEITTRKTQDTIIYDFCPNIVMRPNPENPPPAEEPPNLFR